MPSKDSTSIRVRSATLADLQGIAALLARSQGRSEHLRDARVQEGALTLQAVLDELVRVWWRERSRQATYAARRRRRGDARPAAAPVADELHEAEVARLEWEGGRAV